MTDDFEPRGPSRAQRIIAWPFVLVATLGFLGAAGLLIADVILRYGANAPIRGAQEIVGVVLAGILAVALPVAAILGIRSGGPTHAPPIHRWWTALHTTFLFLVEAVVLAALSLLLLGDAFRRFRIDEATTEMHVSLGLVQTVIGLGLLTAAVLVLVAGAMRLVRGR
jgi:hypothetical protein